MKIKNIEIKRRLKEIEDHSDYYMKAKQLCELAGLVAFLGHVPSGTHEELKKCEDMCRDTIEQIIKKHKL